MKRLFLALALLVIAGAEQASAGSITYTFTGTGTGDLGSASFTNAAFTISEVANTSSIVNCGGGIFSVEDLSSTIAVAGLPVATVISGVRVFDNQTTDVLGYSRPGCSSLDLMDLSSSAFATYNLATSFGRIFVADPFAVNQFNCNEGCVTTNRGNIEFSSIVNVTFTASTTPEPGTVELLGLGSLGIGFVRRLRRKKSRLNFDS